MMMVIIIMMILMMIKMMIKMMRRRMTASVGISVRGSLLLKIYIYKYTINSFEYFTFYLSIPYMNIRHQTFVGVP